MKELIFEQGEIRTIEYQVRSTVKNDGIVITDSDWKLTNIRTKQCVASGNCDIQDDVVSAVINFDTPGYYYLDVSVVIPPETIIERLNIRVVE